MAIGKRVVNKSSRNIEVNNIIIPAKSYKVFTLNEYNNLQFNDTFKDCIKSKTFIVYTTNINTIDNKITTLSDNTTNDNLVTTNNVELQFNVDTVEEDKTKTVATKESEKAPTKPKTTTKTTNSRKGKKRSKSTTNTKN